MIKRLNPYNNNRNGGKYGGNGGKYGGNGGKYGGNGKGGGKYGGKDGGKYGKYNDQNWWNKPKVPKVCYNFISQQNQYTCVNETWESPDGKTLCKWGVHPKQESDYTKQEFEQCSRYASKYFRDMIQGQSYGGWLPTPDNTGKSSKKKG